MIAAAATALSLVVGVGHAVKGAAAAGLLFYVLSPTGLQATATTMANAAEANAKHLSAVVELMEKRDLVVVAHDHWLMDVICRSKRNEHRAWMAKDEEEQDTMMTTACLEERKTAYLRELLSEVTATRTPILSNDDAKALSERVVRLASYFSGLLPAYEPLLVEVALVHCLHEWKARTQNHSKNRDKGTDVVDFETYLLTQLQSKQATAWFNCQFFIDSLDLLSMAPLFYKQRIQNQELQVMISVSIVETRDSAASFCEKMLMYFTKKENEVAFCAWKAWLSDGITTVGALRRDEAKTTTTAPMRLLLLRKKLLNAIHLDAHKRGYFPTSVEIKHCFCSTGTVYHDLSGVISAKETDSTKYFAGFIYHGDPQRSL